MAYTTKQPAKVRIRRAMYRSHRRGTREMDVLLGAFAERYLPTFDESQLVRFETLLEHGDPDLFDWMTARETVPREHDHDVMRLLRDFALNRPAR